MLLLTNYGALLFSGVLIIVYIVMLRHIVRANKNKWLLLVTTQLLFASIFTFLTIFYGAKVLKEDDWDTFPIFMMTGCNALTSLCFNWSHLLLAYKYRNIARVVPYKINK